MSNIINKVLILNRLKEHFKCNTKQEFARFLNIGPTTLSAWYSRDTFDLNILYAKCVGVDWNKLLSGLNYEDISLNNDEGIKQPAEKQPEKEDLFKLLKEKDGTIIVLSEKIGELKYENKQLRANKGYNLAAEP